MRTLTLIIIAFAFVDFCRVQESMQQVMEKRAREMHRVLASSDKGQWREFIEENYTQAFIDRPMQSRISKSDNGSNTSEKKEIHNHLEGKVSMFESLHNDFGASKIIALTPKGRELAMTLNASDLSGIFTLTFSASEPYLIEGLGIRVEGGGH